MQGWHLSTGMHEDTLPTGTEVYMYRNKKSGTIYEWLAVVTDATNSRDGTPAVLYRKQGSKALFVRESWEFYDKFEPVNGQQDGSVCPEGG